PSRAIDELREHSTARGFYPRSHEQVTSRAKRDGQAKKTTRLRLLKRCGLDVRCSAPFARLLQHGQERLIVVIPRDPVGVASEAATVDTTQAQIEPLGAIRVALERGGHADDFKFVPAANAQDWFRVGIGYLGKLLLAWCGDERRLFLLEHLVFGPTLGAAA